MVAVNVLMPDVPPMLSVALAACVRPPVPDRAVPTVNELLLVNVTPVTVTLGIENVPVNPWLLVSNVCSPVLAVKVPLFVMPFWNVGVIAALSVQLAPAFMVTKPVKVLLGFVAEEKANVPVAPPPTVVVPPTLSVNAPMVSEVPLPVERVPVIAKLAAVVVVTLPLTVKLPPIAVVPACITSVPLPLNVRW